MDLSPAHTYLLSGGLDEFITDPYHKGVIESSPLQIYVSALLLSPVGSLIKTLFQHEEPRRSAVKPGVNGGWSAYLQTLKGHSNSIASVVFSHNSTQLASASWDSTFRFWDASSGACLQIFKSYSR